jgi:hypothetical protein
MSIKDELEAEYEQYKDDFGSVWEGGSYQASDQFLPVAFFRKVARITPRIVAHEWMLHKLHRSEYIGYLIIRVALFQMQTGATTEGTFLDLLVLYVNYFL